MRICQLKAYNGLRLTFEGLGAHEVLMLRLYPLKFPNSGFITKSKTSCLEDSRWRGKEYEQGFDYAFHIAAGVVPIKQCQHLQNIYYDHQAKGYTLLTTLLSSSSTSARMSRMTPTQ